MPENKKIVNTQLIEEKLNSITHSIGAGMSIAGLIFLLILSRMNSGGVIRYVSFSLYGAFQVLLYLSSSLTHLFTDYPKIHSQIRIIDQASIYLLIAGTYTPISLLALPSPWSWWVFGIIWILAFAGILLKTVFIRGRNIASDLLYLPMGWLIIAAFKPLKAVSPPGLIMWTILGGSLYSGGIVFYLWKKLPFSHVLWHLFVLAGGISFYLGFVLYLT